MTVNLIKCDCCQLSLKVRICKCKSRSGMCLRAPRVRERSLVFFLQALQGQGWTNGQTVVRGWLHSPPEYLNKWLFPAYGSIIVLLLPYNHPFRSIFNTCLVLDLYSLAEKKINDNCKALVMMVRSLTAVHTPLWRSVLGYHPLQWVLRIHPFQAFIVYLWIPNVGRIRDAFLQKVLIQSNVLGVY